MPLFAGRFPSGLNPIVVDAVDEDAAIARLTLEADGIAPAELHPVPDNILCFEVRYPDPPEAEDEDNPANVIDDVVAVFSPVFADWLDAIDEEPVEEDGEPLDASSADADAALSDGPEGDDGEAFEQAGRRYNPPPRASDAD